MFNLPQIEEKILAFWNENKIFQKTLDKPSPRGDYVFYDGPPFATGLPHYGHIVASLMKDIVPRYWTMKGYHVERKWGWDCHGLPIENIVEKSLNLKNKKDIEDLGIEKFNLTCQSKVLTYANEWKKTIRRLGRWVDMENDYKTMDLPYMESIWWVFKQLWEKGLIYEGRKSMHICPRCQTTLSQSEVSQGYLDIEDISVVAKFKLKQRELNLADGRTIKGDIYVLAWTTTPWTLPGNVALAVGKDIDYAVIELENNYYVLAKNNLSTMANDRPYREVGQLKGADLVGLEYQPLFDYYLASDLENKANGYKIYAADFVTVEDGTGVVHIAPAFGEDDLNLGLRYKLPFIQHVGIDGRFKDEVKDFAGLEVKPRGDTQSTDKKVIEFLKNKDLVFDSQVYTHAYPHCWRCDTPLLNYATSSWFVAVTKVKNEAIRLAEQINWTPTHIKHGRFGKWLEGARDWSISRQRFWGSVMPIWQCEQCGKYKVLGSIKELEELSGQKVNDLHKHIVDKMEFKCEQCGGQMKRIPDVLDCWFESGSMPYAQMHYPFENREKFENNFPAEFIAEGVDQTRAWFYYLHVLATALKNKPAFKNVIANGIVLAEDGKKMSKKLNNYPDPGLIFDKYGADPLRYYLAASPVMRAEDLNFNEKDLSEQSRFFNTLFNVLNFYKMFASSEETVPAFKTDDLTHILDKWVVARLEKLKQDITQKMDKYDLNAVRYIPDFVDDLSTWYVRRSRERFKGVDKDDKCAALSVLKHVLLELSKIMAPFLPFTAEHFYQALNGGLASVHLEAWPAVEAELIKRSLLDYMQITRKVVELGLAKRAEVGVKVRQPLNKLTIINQQLPAEYLPLIEKELNVKRIEQQPGSGELTIELDMHITDELKAEGLMREIVRTVNQQRKKMNLTIQDKIILEYYTDDAFVEQVFEKFTSELKQGVLAERIVKSADAGLPPYTLNGFNLGLRIVKK